MLFGIGCSVGITVGYICIGRILHGFFTGKYILEHCPPLCTLLGEAVHCRKVVAYISKHCIVEFHIRIITVCINFEGTSYREEAGRFYTLGTPLCIVAYESDKVSCCLLFCRVTVIKNTEAVQTDSNTGTPSSDGNGSAYGVKVTELA